jgi:hypothetical protein
MNGYDGQRIKSAYQLFSKVKICPNILSRDFDVDTALALMDEDKMICHILNCLAALRIVQIRKSKEICKVNKHELAKRKVFIGAVSMMLNAECNSDKDTILSAFPDDDMMSDGRSWLPLHWAVTLTIGNEISEEDVFTLHAANPLAMRLLSSKINLEGYTPIHLLCMQKKPSLSLVKDFSLRDPKAFVLCDRLGKSALHMIAQYSESLEVLQSVLQIDHTLTTKLVIGPYQGDSTTALGLLCGRHDFPSFHDMFLCLIEVDSTVEVIYYGMTACMRKFELSPYQDVSPGSRGYRTLIVLEKLLDANADAINVLNSFIYHVACFSLMGKLCIAVLSLFIGRNSNGIKCISSLGCLPIHHAAVYSSLDVVMFLVNAYPESISMEIEHGIGRNRDQEGCNLLHLAQVSLPHVDNSEAIVEYLCNLRPALVHMKCAQGLTPLHHALMFSKKLKIESIEVLCNADESVLKDFCAPSDITSLRSYQLPLHLLIEHKTPSLEVSDEGDCFRLFLRMYPASAGIIDSHFNTPYDLAVSKNLSVYFVRLLLNADPTINPVVKRNLNYAARREGMFLAFMALSTNRHPIIWSKIRHEDRNLLIRVILYL